MSQHMKKKQNRRIKQNKQRKKRIAKHRTRHDNSWQSKGIK